MKTSLTQDALRRELLYNPAVGQFIHLRSFNNGVKFGQVAGCLNRDGYVQIIVNGTPYRAHRLAFLWMNEAWPKNQVDHVNGWRPDNRWINLREATNQENQRNSKLLPHNTSGARGVSWDKACNKWRVQICGAGKRYRGVYANKEDAVAAYNQIAKELHGPFFKQPA